MPEMTLNQYQEGASEVAVYPGRGSHKGLNYTVLGVCGEAGELADHLKKFSRDDAEVLTQDREKAIKGELGDILWYVSQCAVEMGWTLEDIGQHNLDKLRSRKLRNKIQGSGDHR